MPIIVITGIDTGIGKTYTTGLLARFLLSKGEPVITAKIVQTGGSRPAEDILCHRQIMGQELSPADEEGLTCPYILSYPASPHLAARLENTLIAPGVIDRALEALHRRFGYVLLEGVGGLCVPLAPDLLFADYLQQRRHPCLVVTSPRLGSINHTVLTVEALLARSIPVLGLCYNLGIPSLAEISTDTREFLQTRYPFLPLVPIPACSPQSPPAVDFSPFFALPPHP